MGYCVGSLGRHLMPDYAIVSSGQSTSAPFTLPRPDHPLVVEVPSLNAGAEVRPQFTATSGTAPFWTLTRPDGSGLPFAVHSGVGQAFGVVEHVPTPWGRIFITSTVTAPTTFTLHSTR